MTFRTSLRVSGCGSPTAKVEREAVTSIEYRNASHSADTSCD